MQPSGEGRLEERGAPGLVRGPEDRIGHGQGPRAVLVAARGPDRIAQACAAQVGRPEGSDRQGEVRGSVRQRARRPVRMASSRQRRVPLHASSSTTSSTSEPARS